MEAKCNVTAGGATLLSYGGCTPTRSGSLGTALNNNNNTSECLQTHFTGQKRLDTLTLAGAELGQSVGEDGGCWKPILRRWADLGHRIVSFLHWTDLFYGLNSAVREKTTVISSPLHINKHIYIYAKQL